MTIGVHTYSAVLRSGASTYPLDLLAGSVTLDEGWAPYVQARFTISTPSQTIQTALDPRNNPRITLTSSVNYPLTWNGPGAPAASSRTFDLGLRSRVIDRKSGETTVEAASDEALLQDWALIATAPDTSALLNQSSLRAIIDNNVLSKIGASLEPIWRVNRTNDAQNPIPSSVTGWQGGGATALSTHSDGTPCFEVTANGSSTPYIFSTTAQHAYASGNQVVLSAIVESSDTASYHFRAHATTGNVYFTSGQQLSVPLTAGKPVRITIICTLSAAVAAGELNFSMVRTTNPAAGPKLRMSKVFIANGSSFAGYFDGSTPAVGQYTYQWTGAAGASSSQEIYTTPGAVDADFTTLAPATNLLLDPGAEVVTVNWITGGATTLARSTAAGTVLHGASSCQVTMTNTSGAVFATASGTVGIPAMANTIYNAQAFIRGNAAGAQALITIRYFDSANAFLRNDSSVAVAVPTAANVWQLLTVTSPTPSPPTTAKMTVYVSINSTASGRIFWIDDAALFLGSGLDTDGVSLIPPFNGGTPDTTLYRYDWQGAANASASDRTPMFDRPPSLLTLNPGENLWDFVTPLLTSAGLRLFCDESRVWRLVNSTYFVPGSATIATGYNAIEGSDTISRDQQGDWYDAVVVEYDWTDAATGLPKQAYDSAQLAGWTKALLVKYERPFPGPGAANYILGRSTGRGRVLDPRALSDYSVTPGQSITVSMPDTVTQTGVVAATTWDFATDEMEVKSRGLTDTPSSAWVMLAAGQKWTDSPVGQSWIAEVV